MKTVNKFLVGLVIATVLASSNAGVFAQTPDTSGNQTPDTSGNKTRQRFANRKSDQTKAGSPDANSKPTTSVAEAQKTSNAKTGESIAALADSTDPKPVSDTTKTAPAAPTSTMPSDVPEDSQANRHEQPSEEAAVVPYYNNFFNTYHLGPEDIISVSVFGQDRYSRSGIIVPPSGRISLALIPGGVFVNGKTVDEVAESIKKRYDEYIIDPQVSVSLDKASSYRYSVIGDVGQPGIRLMSHRMTVTEALAEAGGVLSTGDRSKVVVLRRQADGNLTPIAVNVSAIYKGKAPDVTYLVPGDQVIVPGNKLKSFQKIMTFFPILSFARIFTGGLFP
jgi:protein involved in polysaccharide export with SLBB domain